MSYLNGPRINFWGGGRTNVDTANNESHALVDLVNTVVTASGTDDELIALLRSDAVDSNGNPYYTVGSWNYYGDHQVAFLGTKVSSAGVPGAVTTDDPMAGLPVYLLGSVDPESGAGPYGGPMMADLDPTSSQSTQIYVGGLQVGGAGGADPALLVRADTRCHSHFLGLRYDTGSTAPPYATPGSAWANGTFQLAFPKEAIVRCDRSLASLAAVVDAPGAIGIVVRFCMFEFMPSMSTDDLRASYAANYNEANPSTGRIVGTIGPWFADEPATCPPGRLLQNTKLGGAQGVAYLDANAPRLTLDLSSALQGAAIRQAPKDVTAPIGPNVDYGELRVSAGGAVRATVPSLPDTYYLYGGIYDLPLEAADAKALAAYPLAIGSTKNGLALAESPLRIYSDDRNVYLDDTGGKAEITLRVTHLGAPVPADLSLGLSTAMSGTIPDPAFLAYPATLTVPAGADRITFAVSDNGGPPGFLALNAAGHGGAAYFVNFRKYPKDDFSAVIAAGNIPWETVYEACLRYFYVIFPAMSKRIPLNDPPTIAATAGEILKRLSPAYHDTTMRMPVTRSLSPGRVALLEAYLKEQLAGGA